MATPLRWTLRHEWRSDADLAALALCRDQLAQAGIAFADADSGDAPDAIKMHGMEIEDARAGGAHLLSDLGDVALRADWARSLPGFVASYMIDGPRWHGIPMGVHRANIAWVNRGLATKIGVPAPADFDGFRAWLQQAQHHVESPLAVGAEPWQVGVLFEATVLSVAGASLYEQAFIGLRPSVWREPSMLLALRDFLALRSFVDDDRMAQDWASQLAAVREESAAVQVMGDWARTCAGEELVEWAVPGTAAHFVAVIDYFVPLAQGSKAVAERAALALTEPEFQARFALRKGCLPASGARWPADGASFLPSFTFDQCCAAKTRRALQGIVADHFVRAGDASTLALALTEATS